MVDLLTDMYIANAAIHIKTIKMEQNLNYMPLIYEKYGIDSLRFQNSNVYYMSRIDDYEGIYKKVETRLKEILDTTKVSLNIKDSLLQLGKKSKGQLKHKK